MYKYKVYQNSGNRFTEDEIDEVRKLCEITAFVFDVTVDDIAGTRRHKPLPDARRVISHYAYYNIHLKNVSGERNVALVSWFLDLHHTSVCYYVETCEDIYDTDKKFRRKYEMIMSIFNGEPILIGDDDDVKIEVGLRKNLSWDIVKRSSGFPKTVKESLMPIGVAEKIRDMRECGYSPTTIARYVRCSIGFADWYIKKHGIKVNPKARICNNGPADFVKVPKPTYSINY